VVGGQHDHDGILSNGLREHRPEADAGGRVATLGFGDDRRGGRPVCSRAELRVDRSGDDERLFGGDEPFEALHGGREQGTLHP
jgi:hypothetical protein